MAFTKLMVLLALSRTITTSPAPNPAPIDEAAPLVTASPIQWEATKTKRDLGSYLTSVIGGLGSNIPNYVTDGVANFFQDFPTGSAVQSSLGLDDSQLAAYPTQVLNLGPYANYTDLGWNVRFHGNVYKQPNISESDLNSLANKFLIGTSIDQLPPEQQNNARNLTSEIFVVQQGNVSVTMNIEPAPLTGSSGEPGGSNALTPSGGFENLTIPYNTSAEGDFDAFLPINNISNALIAGNATDRIQQLNIYAKGAYADSGNATAFLVPNKGLTVISDIDDILRVTKIYQPSEGLLNSFARDFVPWMNMPDIYANWSKSLPNMHFHYLTTTPEQATRPYENFIYKTYPGGSFDTRPLNFSDVSATLSIREFLLEKIFQTFPERKFILVADTSNSDVMRDYPGLVGKFPGQVQCIFLRNTSSTDSGDKFPYDTSGFKGINQTMYMFFNVPDDLIGLDIANGQCYNASVKQNVTFSEQGLPLGLSKKSLATSAFREVHVARGIWVAGLAVVLAGLFTGL